MTANDFFKTSVIWCTFNGVWVTANLLKFSGLRILADHSNAVILIVLARPLISNFSKSISLWGTFHVHQLQSHLCSTAFLVLWQGRIIIIIIIIIITVVIIVGHGINIIIIIIISVSSLSSVKITCLWNQENGFKLSKERSRRYPAQTITDDIALLANAPAKVESLLHSLERAAAGIGLHVNAPKKE